MKQKLMLTGLVALSILYLLEVNFSHITFLNWVAFVIIAATLIPLLILYLRYLFHKDEDEDDSDGQNISRQ